MLVVAGVLCAARGDEDEAERQYAVAAGHYTQSRWRYALDEFNVYLEKHEQGKRAASVRFFRGEVLVQLGQYPEARAAFGEYLERHGGHGYADEALFRRGELAFLLNELDAARGDLEAFRQRHAQHENAAYALHYLGEIALRQKDAPRAEMAYAQALREYPPAAAPPKKADPLPGQLRYGLARALQMKGEHAEAARFFQAVSALEGHALADDAHAQCGVCHYHARDHEQAARWLTGLAEKFPQSDQRPVALYWLGLTRLAQEQTEAALAALAEAKIDDQHALAPALACARGRALHKAGQLAEAAVALERVLGRWPESEWADDSLLLRLEIAEDQNDLELIAVLQREFQERFPQSKLAGGAKRLQARAWLQQGKYGEARALLEELRQSGDTSSELWRLLTVALLGAKEYEAALKLLDEIPASRPPELADELRGARAAALVGLEKHAEALPHLRAYLRTRPDAADAPQARAQLVLALWSTDQRAEAETAWNELRARHADHPLTLAAGQRLAAAALEAQEAALAERVYAALGEQRGDPAARRRALVGLARAPLQTRQVEAARAALAALREEFPEADELPELQLRLAALLESEPAEALKLLTTIHDNHPASEQAPAALLRAAALHASQGRAEAAAPLLERVVKDHPKFAQLDAALYQLAFTQADLARGAEANAALLRLYQQHRGSVYWPDAAYRLAEQSLETGDLERASALVDELLGDERLAEGGSSAAVAPHVVYLQGRLAARRENWPAVENAMRKALALAAALAGNAKSEPSAEAATSSAAAEQSATADPSAAAIRAEAPAAPREALTLPAEYWLAEAAWRRQDLKTAGERFAKLHAQITDDSPPWLALAPLRRAQILLAQERPAEALDIAQAAEERFPEFRQRHEFTHLVGRCLAQRGQFSAAREAFERVLRSPEGGGTETAAMAQWMIGETYFHQKAYDNAIKAYLRVERLYAFPKWQAAALFQAGKCAERLDDKRQAALFFAQVVKDFPNSEHAAEAGERLRQAQQPVDKR